MNKDTKIAVKNRSNMTVIYRVPEMGVRREFMPNETKEVPLGELIAVSYRPGGMNLLQNNLVINNKAAMRELGMRVEPEYYLTDADIKELLEHGSMDSFLDCLDFAPIGVIELIKKYAYEMPVNDSRKRQAIKDKTGFDVDLALLHKRQVEEAQRENANETESGMKDLTPERRVKPTAQEAPSNRRTTPKYKVVSRGE